MDEYCATFRPPWPSSGALILWNECSAFYSLSHPWPVGVSLFCPLLLLVPLSYPPFSFCTYFFFSYFQSVSVFLILCYVIFNLCFSFCVLLTLYVSVFNSLYYVILNLYFSLCVFLTWFRVQLVFVLPCLIYPSVLSYILLPILSPFLIVYPFGLFPLIWTFTCFV